MIAAKDHFAFGKRITQERLGFFIGTAIRVSVT